MTLDADLRRWGEPPAGAGEETLAEFLDTALDRLERGETVQPAQHLGDSTELFGPGAELVETATWIRQCATSVLANSCGAAPTDAEDGSFADPVGGVTGAPLPEPFPGEYRIRALLGFGACGRVWLADDLQLGREVALKTLRPRGKAAEAALATLRHEARLLAGLRHANIVQVYTWREAAGEHYLVLQYVPGGSFADRVDAEGALGWQHAARYVADVAEALRELHGRELIHRDIKPANILWDPARDEAILTDFGLTARLASTQVAAGTPLYMAPEAFEGRVTPAGDVYGLAATLFTLATADVPFPAESRDELVTKARRGLADPDPRFAGMPEALERLVRAGLAPKPEARPSLADFTTALRAALNQLLGDTLLLPAAPKSGPAPVELRLTVSRWEGGNRYAPLAATHPEPAPVTRDMKRVPPAPRAVGVRSGDRVRIRVAADREGFLTVFNVGPTGNLNLLYPEDPRAPASAVPANRALDVADVELTPPAGRERLLAVWSRAALSLADLRSLVEGGETASRPYLATRDMKRVQESVNRLRPEDWHAVVLTLDHVD